ncbi:MAG: hypothetical protein JWP61_950 [Friedmanniella sp.]|nr:hypothetical protein [Friedmanniella sp.]
MTLSPTQALPEDSLESEATDPLSFLGFGFHILGRADLAKGVTTAVVKATGNATSSAPTRPFTYVRDSYTSRRETESAFASEVGLDYSGVAFSGEFDATYTSATRDEASSTFGLADITVPHSVVGLTNAGPKNWASAFAANPDVAHLPATFDASTRDQFFGVLATYGTHFVSQVTFGGRMRACLYSSESSSYSQQDAAASMSAEFDGLFSTVSGTGSASWTKVDRSWFETRTFTISALGGDDSLLPVGDHGFDASYDPSPWIASVAVKPMPAAFQLQPLSQLFSGPTQDAMEEAIAAFLDSTAQLTVTMSLATTYATLGSTTLFPQLPAHATDPGSGWIWLLVLDRVSSELVLNQLTLSPAEWDDDLDTKVQQVIDAHPGATLIFGGFYPWGMAALRPKLLVSLAQINGFDLTTFTGVGAQILSYIGSASHEDPHAATGDGGSLRASNTVNVSTNPHAVVDQDGYVF